MKYLQTILIILNISFHFVFAQNGFDKQESIYHLRTNLEYLASDFLEGREAATRGAELASVFLSAKLKEYGIKAFGDRGSFFQHFDIITKQVSHDSNIDIISRDGKTSNLLSGDDFAISTDYLPSTKFNDKDYEIIFAGYGITDEQYNYDDYKGLNVSGKVVLILQGTPTSTNGDFSTVEDYNKYKDVGKKYNNAKNRGAVGLILFPGSGTIKYWPYIRAKALESVSELAYERKEQSNLLQESIPVVRLSEESSINLLSNEKYDYADLSKTEDGGIIPSPFKLRKKVRFDYRTFIEVKEARNVIGIIPGIEDDLKDEFVVLSAHYDHKGKVNGVIYNGADDNGSGTVAILEATRRLSLLKKNERSVLVIFHTAEEKGLLGSEYFTDNCKYLDDIVVDINIDMVGREDLESIFCIGSDRLSTELYEMVEEINFETVNFYLDYRYNDPDDPNNYYSRSDHFNYAKHDIPVVFFYDHMVEDYHKPTDDVEKINFYKIEKVSSLITELSLRVANLNHKLTVDKLEMEIGK